MTDGLRIFDVPGGADDSDASPDAEQAVPRRPRWPGSLAGGVAILMVLTWATGLAVMMGGGFELGVGLSISAAILSVLAVLGGVVAVVGRWGRGWGVAAIVVGVLLNPVVLIYLLSWLGALGGL